MWIIAGQLVKVDTNTTFSYYAQDVGAEVGATVTVVAARDENGQLVAVEITIESPPQIPEQPFEFQGLIEAFGPAQWTVGGYALIITGDTVIEGTPQKWLLAEVKAVRRGDGSLVAQRIAVKLPVEEVQFEGVIQSISAEQWIVEGVTVRLDAQTAVTGTPKVGALAEVDGLLLADGAVLARRIAVQTP